MTANQQKRQGVIPGKGQASEFFSDACALNPVGPHCARESAILALKPGFYHVSHRSPGRLRLRPAGLSGGASRIASQDLAAFILAMPANMTAIHSPTTGSVLLLVEKTRENGRAANTPAKAGPAQTSPPKARKEVRNPVPGKLLSYIYPRLLRNSLAALRALPYILRGLKPLAQRRLGLETLDAAALVACILQRDWRALASIVFFFSLGEYLAEWTRKKSQGRLADSLALNIESVWVEAEGAELEIPLSRLASGAVLIVRAGGVIPADGVLTAGEGMVNQSAMTGEARAVHRVPGDSVFAGTILEEGEIRVLARKVGGETRINAILRYIEESEQAKASVQARYERIADGVVPYNFALAALVYAFTRNARRAASVLLVDYSCAIRLATPLAILAGMREAAEHGVLIKGGKFAEALAEADVAVFDKTGTLTNAQPTVVEIISFSRLTPREILKISACLEEHFPHPVGRAVVRAAEEAGLSHREEHAKTEFIVAHGIASRLNGQRVLLGSAHFILEDSKLKINEEQKEILRRQTALGRSVLFLSLDGQVAGILLIEDRLRPNAPQVIEALRQAGIKRVIMLTGDGAATAAAIAAQAGIDEFHARLLPEEKARFINQLRAEGHTVLMVGDGVNDSPALSAANVGCAMCGGSDMAKETADMVLTGGDLADLVKAREISVRLLRRTTRNFHISVFWNSLFLLGGLSGLLTAGTSAFLHNAATSAIAMGSMRPLLPTLPPALPPVLQPGQKPDKPCPLPAAE